MNIDLDHSNFAYTATIKLSELPKCKTQEDFPGVADLAVNSRNFSNYFDCTNSVKNYMDEVVKTINLDMANDHQFMIQTEVNPEYSGVDTKSKDWSTSELARLWVFEADQAEDKMIMAVGQARVFMIPREPSNNLH